MANKSLSFIGMRVNEFYELIKNRDQVGAQKARLIPIYKVGDEMALTSVFLSSLKLIKEFRKMVSSNIDLPVSGKIHIFTEIEFIEDSKRIDGLILIEKKGVIHDAALLEMKNGRNVLDEKQIFDYIEIADKFNIPKLITVSNQFVTHTTQSPVMTTKKKKVVLYHLSWSYILTLAQILLFDNDINIEDEDQVEIMKEVVNYFEYEKSGIRGFTEMKEGWKNSVDKINKEEKLKKTDQDIFEAAESWLQEEKDMALILSRELGILVNVGSGKYKGDLEGRIKHEVDNIVNNKIIESTIKVYGAASPITVRGKFLRRNIEFSTTLQAPQDKSTIKGQVNWIIRTQIDKCKKKNAELFEKLEKNLLIEFRIRNYGIERVSLDDVENFIDRNKGKTIRDYGVILYCDMGRTFGHKTNSIKKIEELLLDYYEGIIQHLTKWQEPAPEIKSREVQDEAG